MSRIASRTSALTCWTWSESRAFAWSSAASATCCSPRVLAICRIGALHLAGRRVGAVRVAGRGAEVAEVAGDARPREAGRRRRPSSALRRLHLLGRAGEILAILERLLRRRPRVEIVERRVRRGVGRGGTAGRAAGRWRAPARSCPSQAGWWRRSGSAARSGSPPGRAARRAGGYAGIMRGGRLVEGELAVSSAPH